MIQLTILGIQLVNVGLLMYIALIALPVVLLLTLASGHRLHTGLVYYILVMVPFLILSHMYAVGVLGLKDALKGFTSLIFTISFPMFWEACLIKSAKDWGFADWLDGLLPELPIPSIGIREKKRLIFKLTRRYTGRRETYPDLGVLMSFSRKIATIVLQRGSTSDLYMAVVPKRKKGEAVREFLSSYGFTEVDGDLRTTVYSTRPGDAKVILTGDPMKEYGMLPDSFVLVVEGGRVGDVSMVGGRPIETTYISAGWGFRAGRTVRPMPKAPVYRVGLYRIAPYGKEIDILRLRADRECTYYYTDVSSLWRAVFMRSLPTIDWREWIDVPHVAIIGETGSGKSVALANIIKHLVEKGERVLVFDLNGQFHNVYEELRENDHDVRYLDLARDIRIDISNLPVPLTAEIITLTMRSIDLREGDRLGMALSPIAYEVLRGILHELEDIGEVSFERLIELLKAKERMYSRFREDYTTACGALRRRIAHFISPPFISGREDIVSILRELNERGGAVFIGMNVQSRDGRYRITYGEQVLVMMLTLRLVFNIWEENPCRLNIILDEASRVLHRGLGSISSAVLILEEGRKFGLRLILADQVLSVLDDSVQQAPLLMFFRTKNANDLLYIERVMGGEVKELVEGLETGESIMFKAGTIARTEFKHTRLSNYRALVEVPERIYRVERRVYSFGKDEFLKGVVEEVRDIMEEMARRTKYFKFDMTPEEVATLILAALNDGVTLDMLEREELREKYRDLLLKYRLVKVKWKKVILTWRGAVFTKLIKRMPELEERKWTS